MMLRVSWQQFPKNGTGFYIDLGLSEPKQVGRFPFGDDDEMWMLFSGHDLTQEKPISENEAADLVRPVIVPGMYAAPEVVRDHRGQRTGVIQWSFDPERYEPAEDLENMGDALGPVGEIIGCVVAVETAYDPPPLRLKYRPSKDIETLGYTFDVDGVSPCHLPILCCDDKERLDLALDFVNDTSDGSSPNGMAPCHGDLETMKRRARKAKVLFPEREVMVVEGRCLDAQGHADADSPRRTHVVEVL